MSTKKILSTILFLLIPIGALGFEESGIIYNSTVASEQKIALGIRKEGQMGAYNPNIARNARYTGIAYKFDGSRSQGYKSGWYDATTPGCLCEGWGAGFVDRSGRRTYGRANQAVGGVSNIEVKSFVTEETSITSTVWIKDSTGQPVLEVTHRFGPAANVPGALFQALVTMTNISGNTLTDVRYNRTMDWDVHPTEFNERVTIKGTQASAASPDTPKVLNSGNNGFMLPNPFYPGYYHTKWPKWNQVNRDYNEAGPADHGFTASFGFGELVCGQAHTFMIYYGAAANKSDMEAAFASESVPLYSIGQSSDRTYWGARRNQSDVSYGFGFKGVSGTAIAPSLPTKIAALPAGNETDINIVQTYASPVIANNHIYQAVFKFREDHQWEGDILRYELDDDGVPKDSDRFPPVSAADLLKARFPKNDGTYMPITNKLWDFRSGADWTLKRNIWTTGWYDPVCSGSNAAARGYMGIITDSGKSRRVGNQNNFQSGAGNSALPEAVTEPILYNCGKMSHRKELMRLIQFVRGQDSFNEDSTWTWFDGIGSGVRGSYLGDTFHSDLTYVGAPDGSLSSSNSKTEAYFRNANGYAGFKETHKDRPERLYVGSNDGMLHAFDKNLNEVWAFIPPSVLPMLRGLVSENAYPAGGPGSPAGKSNTKWLVDGPIIVKDVYINATSEWKTILVGGLGWGGKSYYVLDITDAWDPQHLFTVNNDEKNKQINYWRASGYKTTYNYADAPENLDFSGLGDTWARPSIFLLPYTEGTTKQRYVMAFGAGYSGGTSTELGNYVYVLDFEPSTETSYDIISGGGETQPVTTGGNIIKKIAITPDSASDIPNGVTANMSVVTADAASTADFWGGIAYFPDLTGQVWKLDMSKTSLGELNSSMWTLTKAFKAEGTLANDRFGYNQMATTLLESTVQLLWYWRSSAHSKKRRHN